MKYRKRIVDDILQQKLRIAGAVLIEGAKYCGKTTTAKTISKSELLLGKSEELEKATLIAGDGISKLLIGDTPKLIDEWQLMPELWDSIRSEVDARQAFGQFVLTGSTVPPDSDKIRHSGTGRFSWVRMRPMSLWESGDSTGTVSLKDIFAGKHIMAENKLQTEDIAFLCSRGGFPSSLTMPKADSLLIPREYVNTTIHSDITRLDGVKRSPEYVQRFMRSYARFQGSRAKLAQICNDMSGITGDTPDIKTISAYHDALKKIFVIEDMPAWVPNLRSKTSIRTSDTRYFVDPSIAVAALESSPDGLMEDIDTLGLIFETLCARDLRIYADALNGHVSHYRDSNGLECDAVIHLYGGKYGLIQYKLGSKDSSIEDAIQKMKDIEDIIDQDNMNPPSFRMVITGNGPLAYRRDDGTYIVPIGCLKP